MNNSQAGISKTDTVKDQVAPAAIQFFDLATTDIMAVQELPLDSTRMERLRCSLDNKIFYDFANTRLSKEEVLILNNGRKFPRDFPPEMVGKFDVFLFEIAQEYGARLFLSTLVQQRLWSWQCGEKDGAHKIEILFREISRAARIKEKGSKTRGRVTDRHKLAKPHFIRELTALQMRVREEFPQTPAEIREYVDVTIEADPLGFQTLRSNKDALLRLLNDSRALAFRGSDYKRTKGDLTPTKVYELWVAIALNRRSPESVRQDLCG